MIDSDLESIRQQALERMRRSERNAKRWLVAAGVFEAVLFVAILLAIDFGNRTQLVVFLCCCLVYGPLALGLFALRAYIDMVAQRILRAVEESYEPSP